jgi:hypothetical protein
MLGIIIKLTYNQNLTLILIITSLGGVFFLFDFSFLAAILYNWEPLCILNEISNTTLSKRGDLVQIFCFSITAGRSFSSNNSDLKES